MSQYAFIDNYSRLGSMGIANRVFYQIAETATNKVQGADVIKNPGIVFLLPKPIQIRISKGLVNVTVAVKIAKDANINQVCLQIQEEVASAISSMTEFIPFKVNVRVTNIV